MALRFSLGFGPVRIGASVHPFRGPKFKSTPKRRAAPKPRPAQPTPKVAPSASEPAEPLGFGWTMMFIGAGIAFCGFCSIGGSNGNPGFYWWGGFMIVLGFVLAAHGWYSSSKEWDIDTRALRLKEEMAAEEKAEKE
jgi:hypothetical protein